MVKKKWLRQKGEKKNDKGQQHGLLWRKHSAGRNGRHYRKAELLGPEEEKERNWQI